MKSNLNDGKHHRTAKTLKKIILIWLSSRFMSFKSLLEILKYWKTIINYVFHFSLFKIPNFVMFWFCDCFTSQPVWIFFIFCEYGNGKEWKMIPLIINLKHILILSSYLIICLNHTKNFRIKIDSICLRNFLIYPFSKEAQKGESVMVGHKNDTRARSNPPKAAVQTYHIKSNVFGVLQDTSNLSLFFKFLFNITK